MTYRTVTTTLLVALLGALGAGCDAVRLADSVDLEFDFFSLRGPSDRLHSPYVAGADLDVFTTHVDREDRAGWTIGTSAPAVIAVTEDLGFGVASVSAGGVGEVDLIVRDETGAEVHRATVEVVQPDRADLLAHGPLLVERPELQPESTDEIRVLVGGEGTFLVRWFADGDRLFGHGALTTEAEAGATAEARRSFVFEDREWVTFRATEAGRHEVRLLANGELTRTITVVGVTEEDIDRVELHGSDETQASPGDSLVVYAQAFAADDAPIYGVEYAWDINGLPEEGLGDLFRYSFTRGVTGELCARHGELMAMATISANEGFVDSTNDIGCSVGGDPGWVGAPALALLFVFGWARRRRARA